jgi:Heterokaryon incompatibility protein (HET)
MEAYSYAPLKHADSLRLLHVNILSDNELCCKVEQFRIDKKERPRYSALSYVWGHGSFSPLACDEKTLQITTTLEEALRQITAHNPNDWIWIDQICINQKDDNERSQQVRLMNLIYEKAQTVLAWIGPERFDTVLAIDLIERVAEVARPLGEDTFQNEESSEREALESLEVLAVEDSQRLGISFDEKDQWVAFRFFFDRPWYQRIWIVQEILPAREAFLLCGPHTVSWDSVKYAATWYSWKASLLHDVMTTFDVDGVNLTVSMNLRWRSRMGSEFFRDVYLSSRFQAVLPN